MQTHIVTIAAVDDTGVDPSTLVELAKHALPTSHLISSSTITSDVFDAEWASDSADDFMDYDQVAALRNLDPEKVFRAPTLPLNNNQARALSSDHGLVSVIVSVDQESYMMAFAEGRQTEGADDHFNLLHELSFDFGHPHKAQASIVAADENALLVHYVTDLSEFLPGR